MAVLPDYAEGIKRVCRSRHTLVRLGDLEMQ